MKNIPNPNLVCPNEYKTSCLLKILFKRQILLSEIILTMMM